MLGRNIRLLVVDDERDILEMVLRYLRRRDYLPNGFWNPLSALQEFELDPGRYAMLITDVNMPGMTGIDLANEMLKINPSLKVMYMTANQNLKGVSKAKIIHKPFPLEEFGNKVRELLNS